MHTWSQMKKRLEQEHLAPALRGRLTYFVTAYHGTHDGDEGRAAIRLDGCEILKSNYYDRFGAMFAAYRERLSQGEDGASAWRQAGYDALASGEFYQADFYRAFAEYENQPIAESLRAENAVVRMFALLDRRVGKRTLLRLKTETADMPQWLQMILFVRMEAEGLLQTDTE